jgi:hypothetical protein
VYVAFPGAACPLVDGSAGEFRSIRARGVSPRWTFKDVFDADQPEERRALARSLFAATDAQYERCERASDRNLITFTQRFSHPSLRLGRRTMTLDRVTGRAQVEVKADRLPDFEPEIFYVGFYAPVEDAEPQASLAGQPFRPGLDNLPGTCRDFFCVDGWLRYGRDPAWLWFSRDTALVAVGRPRPSERAGELPGDRREFWAQVFDNTWDTNFDANAWGRMSFRFDLAAEAPARPGEMFEALATECVVLVNARDKV